MDCKETLAEKNIFSSIFSKTAKKYLTHCHVVKQNVLRAKILAFKNRFS